MRNDWEDEGIPETGVVTVIIIYLATVGVFLAGMFVMVSKFLQAWSGTV